MNSINTERAAQGRIASEMQTEVNASRLPWLRKLIHRVLPVHVYGPLRFELRMAWVRLRSLGTTKRFAGKKDMLVNLGAGSTGQPGWVNVDACTQPGINCVYDCRKKLPFHEGSVKYIFCEHFFEHLDHEEEAPRFLRECVRVLKPGGVLRLIVPDAEKYLRGYCANGWEELSQTRPLLSGREDFYTRQHYTTKLELINAVFRQGFEHKYAYDAETLGVLLEQCGFSTVKRQAFGESLAPELCLDQPMRASESLYIEAVR